MKNLGAEDHLDSGFCRVRENEGPGLAEDLDSGKDPSPGSKTEMKTKLGGLEAWRLGGQKKGGD